MFEHLCIALVGLALKELGQTVKWRYDRWGVLMRSLRLFQTYYISLSETKRGYLKTHICDGVKQVCVRLTMVSSLCRHNAVFSRKVIYLVTSINIQFSLYQYVLDSSKHLWIRIRNNFTTLMPVVTQAILNKCICYKKPNMIYAY